MIFPVVPRIFCGQNKDILVRGDNYREYWNVYYYISRGMENKKRD
jgi:hypothetical protein